MEEEVAQNEHEAQYCQVQDKDKARGEKARGQRVWPLGSLGYKDQLTGL